MLQACYDFQNEPGFVTGGGRVGFDLTRFTRPHTPMAASHHWSLLSGIGKQQHAPFIVLDRPDK